MLSIMDKSWIHEYAGLSTDTKPISDERNQILNGSVFVEMDTGDKYMYDDENSRWWKMKPGVLDYITAPV